MEYCYTREKMHKERKTQKLGKSLFYSVISALNNVKLKERNFKYEVKLKEKIVQSELQA